jgi:glycosyltransferase involved in cell wall biosynthesis
MALKICFVDTVRWDYDVSAPLTGPLGGSQSALCYLAVALAQRGHAVTTLTGRAADSEVMGVESLAIEGRLAADFLRARAFDAVIVLNGPAELSGLKLDMPAGTVLALWTQVDAGQAQVAGLARRNVRKRWDAIAAVSDWHRATLIERLGAEAERVSVLRNAIAPAFAGMWQDQAALAAAKSAPLLAYTSTPFRGLDVLVDVFPSVRAAHPDARLEIYSDLKVYRLDPGDEARVYGPLYARARAQEGVAHPGTVPQPELCTRLGGASVLAYPNTFAETSCIAVMEAMAAGLEVVTSAYGALPETTMGHAALVPFDPDPARRGAFAAAFRERLLAVLARKQADPQGWAAARFAQVEATNRACTWPARAAQWESAIAAWQGGRRYPD